MIKGVTPYVITDGNGQEAVAFYENVLEAKVIHVQTFGDLPESPEFSIPEEAKNRLVHAHLKVGDTDLMISDTFPGPHPEQQPFETGNHVTVAVSVTDVEKAKEVFAKLEDGGKVVKPLQETHFSPSYGQVTDKFDVTWHVSTENVE